jgi:hypothetical protein
LRPGQNGVGSIVLVKRRENDHGIAWIADCDQRNQHPFRTATGHHKMSIRIDFEAHQSGLFFSQGLPEFY